VSTVLIQDRRFTDRVLRGGEVGRLGGMNEALAGRWDEWLPHNDTDAVGRQALCKARCVHEVLRPFHSDLVLARMRLGCQPRRAIYVDTTRWPDVCSLGKRETADVLRKAKEHLETKSWIQDLTDLEHRSCMIGATYIAKTTLVPEWTSDCARACRLEVSYLDRAASEFPKIYYDSCATDWERVAYTNDNKATTKEDVLHIMTRAIQLAEEQP